MHIRVQYGISQNYSDVTQIASEKCVFNDVLVIPATDVDRASIFGDPIPFTLKHILLTIDNVDTVYENGKKIVIDVIDINDVTWAKENITLTPQNKLSNIHKTLNFIGGSLLDEYPEQIMAVKFISPENKVLEIGSNIGRNTLVIASLLENSSNLVTLESDANTCITLEKNKSNNNLFFHIEPSALSYRKLIQKGWNTIVSDDILPGYFPVSIITFEELQAKYNIEFDTLVADCEGALYYILQDNPDILSKINTIIMENDYTNIAHKHFVDSVLKSQSFERIYHQSGGWGPCYSFFFETWKRISPP